MLEIWQFVAFAHRQPRTTEVLIWFWPVIWLLSGVTWSDNRHSAAPTKYLPGTLGCTIRQTQKVLVNGKPGALIPNPDKYNFYFTQQASAGVALRHKMAETAETFKLLMEKKIEAEAQTAAARQAEFDLLKESLAARGAPAASSTAPAPSAMARLKELKELRDDGLLTAEEFESKRKAIVDAM